MEENKMIALASEYIDAHRTEMLDLWKELVTTESGNMDKEGVDRVCGILKNQLAQSGARVKVIPMETKGNFLLGEFHPERAGEPALLIGHMDTVFAKGTLEKNPFRIEDGKAYGPGILDMKAGLVMAVFILRALDACGFEKRPLRVVFAGDEENGHRESTAEEEIRRACEGCAAAFNFETGFLDDGLVVGRKGSCRVTVEVEGVAAHAGNDPERGRSAILEMAHKVIEIQRLHDYGNGLFVNVGVIEGGTVANAVPASCRIQIDIRYSDRKRLDETIQRIRDIAEKNHVPDTKATVSMTKPSEVMEVSEANNHSMEEYAVVETLFERTKLALASIITL